MSKLSMILGILFSAVVRCSFSYLFRCLGQIRVTERESGGRQQGINILFKLLQRRRSKYRLKLPEITELEMPSLTQNLIWGRVRA